MSLSFHPQTRKPPAHLLLYRSRYTHRAPAKQKPASGRHAAALQTRALPPPRSYLLPRIPLKAAPCTRRPQPDSLGSSPLREPRRARTRRAGPDRPSSPRPGGARRPRLTRPQELRAQLPPPRPGPHLSSRKRGRPPAGGIGGARPPRRRRGGPGPAATSTRRRARPGETRARRATAPSSPAAGEGRRRPGAGRAQAGRGTAGRHVTRWHGPPGRGAAAPPDRRGAWARGGARERHGRPGFRRGPRPGRAEGAGGRAGASASPPRRSRSPSPTRSLARPRAHAGRARPRRDTDSRSERRRQRRTGSFLSGGRGSGRALAEGRGSRARRGGAPGLEGAGLRKKARPSPSEFQSGNPEDQEVAVGSPGTG